MLTLQLDPLSKPVGPIIFKDLSLRVFRFYIGMYREVGVSASGGSGYSHYKVVSFYP